MGIGIRLRKLWRLKLGLVISIALALFAGLWSVQKISLSPPGLTPRSLEMATASTHVLVDSPTSAMVDLRQDTYSVDGLRNRAVVLGNVIASSQVQARIAARAHVPVERLRIQAPLTAQQPSAPVDSENARHTSDILKSTDQYRIDLKANPTVPMLDIYAQTPTAESAGALANAAVDELNRYLEALVGAAEHPAEGPDPPGPAGPCDRRGDHAGREVAGGVPHVPADAGRLVRDRDVPRSRAGRMAPGGAFGARRRGGLSHRAWNCCRSSG